MNFIVSLAHFCEVHGPTSILCTQVLPPECSICDAADTGTEVDAATPQPSSTSQSRAGEDFEGSAGGLLPSQTATPRPLTPRGSRNANSISSDSSSSLSSPMETPPASPRSPALTSSSLPSSAVGSGIGSYTSTVTSGGSSSTETCRNCCISLPKSIGEKLQGSGSSDPPRAGDKNSPKPLPPVLRTRELVPGHAPEDLSQFGSGWNDDNIKDSQLDQSKEQHNLDISGSSHNHPSPASCTASETSSQPSKLTQPRFGNIPPRSSASSSLNSDNEDSVDSDAKDLASSIPIPPTNSNANGNGNGRIPHSHYITYLSTRAPSTAESFSMLRQSCIRSLSCELLPAQTGPVLFGDRASGYTIAYIFRIADPKARGGKRSYSLLCICPEEKLLVPSWQYVVGTFEGLVQRIKGFAALKNAKDKAAAAKTSPTNLPATAGSGGTLSGRIGGVTGPEGFLRRRDGVGSAKGLPELVGKEDLFVEIHACFVKLLAGLVRRYGYLLAAGASAGRLSSLAGVQNGEQAGRNGNGADWTKNKSMAAQGGVGPNSSVYRTNLIVDGGSPATRVSRSMSTDGRVGTTVDTGMRVMATAGGIS